MPKWEKMTVGDLCDTISNSYRGDDKEVVLINTSDVLEGKVLNHQVVENKNLKGQFKKTFKENDILYSEIRPANKRYAFVDFSDTDNYIASTKLMVLRPRMDVVRPRFLFSFLSSKSVLEELQQLAETRSGTFPQITFSSELAPTPINVPDLETQDRIVGILGVIERKISMNAEINKNLLQQSLYIFETLINSTSKDGCIGDYCTLKSGFAFKSKWWQDSGIPVIKIGSINQDYLNLSNCSHVSEDKISLAKDFIVSGGDLLIAMTGATIGKFTMVPKIHKTILVNQRVGKFFLGENPINKIPFIYCTLKQPEIISEIINRGQGSAQPNISASDIMSIPCVIPQTDEINNFNLQTAPMFELIINNQFENLILAKTRDLLLPRLMSGEIDTSNISF